MKKIKFADINVGDWIYWVDSENIEDTNSYFVSEIMYIYNGRALEDWYSLNDTIKKFDKVLQQARDKASFTKANLSNFDVVRKLTKKEVEQFKVKLTVASL